VGERKKKVRTTNTEDEDRGKKEKNQPPQLCFKDGRCEAIAIMGVKKRTRGGQRFFIRGKHRRNEEKTNALPEKNGEKNKKDFRRKVSRFNEMGVGRAKKSVDAASIFESGKRQFRKATFHLMRRRGEKKDRKMAHSEGNPLRGMSTSNITQLSVTERK